MKLFRLEEFATHTLNIFHLLFSFCYFNLHGFKCLLFCSFKIEIQLTKFPYIYTLLCCLRTHNVSKNNLHLYQSSNSLSPPPSIFLCIQYQCTIVRFDDISSSVNSVLAFSLKSSKPIKNFIFAISQLKLKIFVIVCCTNLVQTCMIVRNDLKLEIIMDSYIHFSSLRICTLQSVLTLRSWST